MTKQPNRIQVKETTLIDRYIFEGKLEEIIEMLQDWKNEGEWEGIVIDYDDDETSYLLYTHREETDKEYDRRMKEIEKQKAENLKAKERRRKEEVYNFLEMVYKKTDLDIIKECRQTGRTRTTTKNLLEKAYYEQMTEIQKTEGEIKVLQAKLELLKEMEKHKTPCEEAFKDWMGVYPPTNPSVDNIFDIRWRAFQMGYNAAYEEKVAQEPEELKTLYDVLRELDKPMFTDDVCSAVKRWMSQYADNVMTGEYLKGYEECLTVLEENLK